MLKQWLFASHKVLLSGYSPRILERRGCRQWGVPFQMDFGKSETSRFCAVGTLRPGYRNVVSLGFALENLRPMLWCVICPGLETARLQSAQLDNSALCLQRPFQPDS